MKKPAQGTDGAETIMMMGVFSTVLGRYKKLVGTRREMVVAGAWRWDGA